MRLRAVAGSAEVLAADLFALGALGLEESDPAPGLAELAAWFRVEGVDEGGLAAAARSAGATVVADETVAPEDWLARYRRGASPFALGRRFLADPRDPDDPGEPEAREGRCLLRLPARTAFGTGSHESTRLAVELLELDPPTGAVVLDVGTGSGVLAYVSLLLGAKAVVGVDLDPAAALVAGQIAALNGLEPRLAVGGIGCIARAARFDRILVNVIPTEWLGGKEAVAGLLAPRGRLLVSGLLAEQREEVSVALATCGLQPVAERVDGEWLALWLERRDAA